MEHSGTSDGPNDDERVRQLEEALRAERAERRRLEDSCDEVRALIHSLNNALSIISTFAAELDVEIAKESTLRESVDEIVRASKRAGAVTRRISDLQRGSGEGHGRA